MAAQHCLCPTLTVPSDPRMLSIVRSFVEAVCHARQVDWSTIHAVVLATGEAVTNIVRHAHRDRLDRPFQVQCEVDSQTVVVTLVDEGEPFDLNLVPRLDPSELRIGGRGVFLMRTLMDEVSCQTLGSCGNRLRLLKRWPSAAKECG
jgi:serine/threonine-protein kinase RsbW